MNLTMENKADVDLPLTVYITSELFSYKFDIEIKGKETLTKEVSLDVSPDLVSGDYKLEIKAYKENNLRGEFTKQIYLGEKSDIEIKEEKQSNFLKKTIQINLVNEGNTVVKDSFVFNLNLFSRMFMNAVPEATSVNTEQGYQLKWDYELSPGEVYTIEVTINYRPLLAIIILIIILLTLIRIFFYSGISVKKTIKRRVHGYQIDLVIKNHGRNNVRNVRVVEVLPRVLQPTGDYGIMKPENVSRGRRGLRMEWEIPFISNNGEVILSYRVEVKADVFGEVNLFGTMVKYINKYGKSVMVKSNSLKISLNCSV